VQALDMFVSIYGAEAGNLALKALAVGGVFVGGGIAPKIRAKLEDGMFVSAFRDKGRLADLMATIPVHLVLEPRAALLGAAAIARSLLSGAATRARPARAPPATPDRGRPRGERAGSPGSPTTTDGSAWRWRSGTAAIRSSRSASSGSPAAKGITART